MPLKVFISHQKADSASAMYVSSRLWIQHGIDTYLDVIDPAIAKSGEALADHVHRRLGECTQLLAIVSAATKTSWWVPWEIGVASEKDFPLATYGGDTLLPEYLHKWPVLKTDEHLDAYALASKSASRLYNSKRMAVEAAAARRSATQEFYRVLRRQIGQ